MAVVDDGDTLRPLRPLRATGTRVVLESAAVPGVFIDPRGPAGISHTATELLLAQRGAGKNGDGNGGNGGNGDGGWVIRGTGGAVGDGGDDGNSSQLVHGRGSHWNLIFSVTGATAALVADTPSVSGERVTVMGARGYFLARPPVSFTATGDQQWTVTVMGHETPRAPPPPALSSHAVTSIVVGVILILCAVGAVAALLTAALVDGLRRRRAAAAAAARPFVVHAPTTPAASAPASAFRHMKLARKQRILPAVYYRRLRR